MDWLAASQAPLPAIDCMSCNRRLVPHLPRPQRSLMQRSRATNWDGASRGDSPLRLSYKSDYFHSGSRCKNDLPRMRVRKISNL